MDEPSRIVQRLLAQIRRRSTAAGMQLLARADYDPRDTLVITGSPRSGTTWVAQTLSAIPGSAVLFEPLHPRKVRLARATGFSWRTYVRPGTRWPDGERALDEVLRGRVLTAWTVQEIRRPKRVGMWIVKFIRANRMLPWITERFPIRPPLLLLRHPCAVVASQLAAGWVGDVERHDLRLEEDFPQVKGVLDAIETPHEHRAARWAIDALVPLSYPKPHPWITLPYERLVHQGDALDSAFERWDLERPAGLRERMKLLSSTTLPSRGRNTSSPLTDWTERLTRDEVRRILAVTHALGLDFYGEDPEPDAKRLRRWLDKE